MCILGVVNRSNGGHHTEAEVCEHIRSWGSSQNVLPQSSGPAVYRGSLCKICRGHWYVT